MLVLESLVQGQLMKCSQSEGLIMSMRISGNLARFAILSISGTIVIIYAIKLHPQSIPEWLTIPILLITLALALWRKSSWMPNREMLDVLVGCCLFGNGFAVCWMKNKMGLLTSLFGALFAICLLSAIYQLIRGGWPRCRG